jgi:hypothetical protein
MESLLTDCRIIRHSNQVAAGQSAIEPAAGVDCAGYDGVLFIVEMAAITELGEQSIQAQESDDDGVVDTYADITGATITVPDTGDFLIYLMEVRPAKRYARCKILRSIENSALEGIIAILFGAKMKGTNLQSSSGISATVQGTVFPTADLGSTVGGAVSMAVVPEGS